MHVKMNLNLPKNLEFLVEIAYKHRALYNNVSNIFRFNNVEPKVKIVIIGLRLKIKIWN